jgi:ABC-type phosphate transport system substrate-binding protein
MVDVLVIIYITNTVSQEGEMTTVNTQRLRVVTLLLALLCLVSSATAAGYTVIANKSVEVDALSKADLQAIFLGEKVKWDNRKYIKIVLLEAPAIQREFLQNVVGKTPSQYDNHWSKLVFTGKATMPQSFADQARLVEFVAGKPGSIGFVPAGQVGDTVKIISIK